MSGKVLPPHSINPSYALALCTGQQVLCQQKGCDKGDYLQGVMHMHGRVLCTWQLLGLAVKEPWLALSGLIPTLTV